MVWDAWHIDFGDHTAPGPVRFDTRQYYAELIRAGTDRWWEAPRTASPANWPAHSAPTPRY